jgi:hypothetical protein
MPGPAAAIRCSNGTHCVTFPTLGEPAKLSRGNPGPMCFACEERRVAAELEKVAEKSKARQRPKANGRRLAKDNEPNKRICVKDSCQRPGVERGGAEFVCREHAEVSRASAIRERRKTVALDCERAVRSAIASGDERLEREWSRLLLVAEVRLAEAEAKLRTAQTRARSTTAPLRTERLLINEG